jgi:hypothetical protein
VRIRAAALQLIHVLGGHERARVIPTNSQAILDSLSGTYRLTAMEKVGAAWQAFWRALALWSLALGIGVTLAASLTPATWEVIIASHAYGLAYSGTFVLAILAAYRGATTLYVFEAGGVRVATGWFPGWRVPREQIAAARVTKGMFKWLLFLSLLDGKERVVILPKSMRRALGIDE